MIEVKRGKTTVMIRTPDEITALRDEQIRIATFRIMAAAAIEYREYEDEMARRALVVKRKKAPHFHF